MTYLAQHPGYGRRLSRIVVRAVGFVIVSMHCRAADIVVGTVTEMLSAAGTLTPGDSLVLSDGVYSNFSLAVGVSGTTSQRISIKAQHPGQVLFSGGINVLLSGSYLTLQDIAFRDGGVGSARDQLIYISGSHNRVTGCAFDDFNQGNHDTSGYPWVYVPGHNGNQSNRVDHCSFTDKTSGGSTVFYYLPSTPTLQGHRIDHNYFSRPPLGRNGGSSIRVGSGTLQPGNPDWVGGTAIEHNLFEHADGENEIITVKSSRNTIRYNTFLNCEGRLSLRHGHDNLVQGNFFLQNDWSLSHADGVAVRGDGHQVLDNYFEELLVDTRYPHYASVAVYAGVSTNISALHEVAHDCLIRGNTVANSHGLSLSLKADLGSAGKNLLPSDIVLENNTFLSRGETLLGDDPGNVNITWAGNLAWGGPVGLSPVPAGVATNEAPCLTRDADGILRPSRPEGAPLTVADVGPAWWATKPGQARFVRPDDGAADVGLPLLQWTDGGGATGHRVHLGTSANPPLVSVQNNLSYVAGNLLPSTTYYWRVDEVNAEGTTPGITRTFTTGDEIDEDFCATRVAASETINIRLETVTGRRYQLERSEGSLTNWASTGLGVVGDGGAMTLFTVPGAATSANYRVTAPPF